MLENLSVSFSICYCIEDFYRFRRNPAGKMFLFKVYKENYRFYEGFFAIIVHSKV